LCKMCELMECREWNQMRSFDHLDDDERDIAMQNCDDGHFEVWEVLAGRYFYLGDRLILQDCVAGVM